MRVQGTYIVAEFAEHAHGRESGLGVAGGRVARRLRYRSNNDNVVKPR